MRRNSIHAAVIATACLLAFTGCATTAGRTGQGKQVLVCPQCKMVEVRTGPPHYVDSKDACPGCQGAMETLLREGKLQHKCSICKQAAFTCPVRHPW